MEKLIKELKQIVTFKDTTDVGDFVLVAAKKPQMLVYALVTEIEVDSSRRDEWWKVSLQFLSIPPQKTSWTLRTPQMTGMEIFTMGGEERFIKAVKFDSDPVEPVEAEVMQTKKKKTGPVLKRIK